MDLAKNVMWHVSAVLATLALQCLFCIRSLGEYYAEKKDMRINKMPVRPQAAPETKRDKENGREARQGKPKIGAYGRGPKKRRPYTGNSKKYFKKDVTMQ